jgi:hypothetical protein
VSKQKHCGACGNAVLAAMRIRLEDHALVDDLCAHYARSGFAVNPVGEGVIEVAQPGSPAEEQERRELMMHLRIWTILNPDAEARILG